jgi:hypothetical protein
LYDLVAIVRVRDHEALANLVTGCVQGTPGIEATNTLIAFFRDRKSAFILLAAMAGEDLIKLV